MVIYGEKLCKKAWFRNGLRARNCVWLAREEDILLEKVCKSLFRMPIHFVCQLKDTGHSEGGNVDKDGLYVCICMLCRKYQQLFDEPASMHWDPTREPAHGQQQEGSIPWLQTHPLLQELLRRGGQRQNGRMHQPQGWWLWWNSGKELSLLYVARCTDESLSKYYIVMKCCVFIM